VTPAQPTVGQVGITPKVISTTLIFSRQWKMQSGPAGELLLRQQLLGAVGTLLDQLFFTGTGASGQPTGLLATPGINITSGTSLAHAGVLAMRRQVLAAGGREAALSWVGTPAVQEVLGARERSTGGGRFLWDGATILDRPASATASAPAGLLAAGDFSQAVMGVWGPSDLLLEIDPYTFFQTNKLQARVVLMADFGIPNPGAFSVAATVT
jgi:HK97 family phage major capsid protein